MLENVNEYARFFDSNSKYWYDEPRECNTMFLRIQEDYCNYILKKEGKVYLNQVYDMLGLPITDPDSRLGWKYDPDKGKQQVDFGVFDLYDQYRFECLYEESDSCILLDFKDVCLID